MIIILKLRWSEFILVPWDECNSKNSTCLLYALISTSYLLPITPSFLSLKDNTRFVQYWIYLSPCTRPDTHILQPHLSISSQIMLLESDRRAGRQFFPHPITTFSSTYSLEDILWTFIISLLHITHLHIMRGSIASPHTQPIQSHLSLGTAFRSLFYNLLPSYLSFTFNFIHLSIRWR